MNQPEPFLEPLTSQLLVAGEHLCADPNFSQGLVYVVRHDLDGSLGFLMNHPTGRCLEDLAPDAELPAHLARVPIYLGGPVQRNHVTLAVFYLDEAARVACLLNPGLEQIEKALACKWSWLRAFAGYAGWLAGQLENELANEDWLVSTPCLGLFVERFSPHLWPLFHANDFRWRILMPNMPENVGEN